VARGAAKVKGNRGEIKFSSGPGKITLNEDGTETVEGGGNWLITLLPTDVPDFQPRMLLSSGRITFDFDPEVGFTSLAVRGKIVDVCAALGD
jgi:hypothetical protein